MGSQRTSNKDIADKLDTLIGLLTAQAQNQTVTPSVTEAPQPKAGRKLKISEDYLAKMQPKWQALANKRGSTVVGYAYRKSNGKVGLWGCDISSYADVEQRDSTIGAVMEVHPS